MSEPSIINRRFDLRLRETRDGYITGSTSLFGIRFDVEAFRVDEEGEPNGARPRRTREVLAGLLIDDVQLKPVELPGFTGLWFLFIYPGEDPGFDDEWVPPGA